MACSGRINFLLKVFSILVFFDECLKLSTIFFDVDITFLMLGLLITSCIVCAVQGTTSNVDRAGSAVISRPSALTTATTLSVKFQSSRTLERKFLILSAVWLTCGNGMTSKYKWLSSKLMLVFEKKSGHCHIVYCGYRSKNVNCYPYILALHNKLHFLLWQQLDHKVRQVFSF